MKPHSILLLSLTAISLTAFAAINGESPKAPAGPTVMIRADISRQIAATETAPAKKEYLQRPVIFTTAGQRAVLTIEDSKGEPITVELTITLPESKAVPATAPQ